MEQATHDSRKADTRPRTSGISVASIIAAALILAGCGAASSAGERATRGGCDPNYEGACLDPDSPDYDCEHGEGNGPDYTGPVRVVGDDPHGLDRDGDGSACEW